MPHETALGNSKSGFSDDEDTMSKMNVKGMDEMKVKKKKSLSVNAHYFA